MNYIAIILFLIAAFHFCIYYCNIDLFPKKPSIEMDFSGLTETKENLEKQLKELKQYSSISTNG
jgi:hypothetical protein